MFKARCLLILTLLLISAYFYGCGIDSPDIIDSTRLKPGRYRMKVSSVNHQNSFLKSIETRIDNGTHLEFVELLLPDESIIFPRISTGRDSELLVKIAETDYQNSWELLVEIEDFVGVREHYVSSGSSTGFLGFLSSIGSTNGTLNYHQYNGKILETLRPEGIDLLVVEKPVVEKPVVKIHFCEVGDVLRPGKSCMDGTGDVFTVFKDGSGNYLFDNYDSVNRHFRAEKQEDGRWKIQSVSRRDSRKWDWTGFGIDFPVIEKPTIEDKFCQVGDILRPGESCLDGTGNVFSVTEWGRGQLSGTDFYSRVSRINSGNFSAEMISGFDTWKILSVTPPQDPPSQSEGHCRVGDVLSPSDSCNIPGTNAVFTVLANGSANYREGGTNITFVGKGITLGSFSAEKQNDGTWIIRSLPPSTED